MLSSGVKLLVIGSAAEAGLLPIVHNVGEKEGDSVRNRRDSTAGKAAMIPEESQIDSKAGLPDRVPEHHSLITAGHIIEGNITGAEGLVIGGSVKGEILLEGQRLVIERTGRVEANVQAESAVIEGFFKGTLTAGDLVKIEKTARFEGDLIAPRFQFEEGAKIKGSFDVQRVEEQQEEVDEPGHALHAD